MGCFPLSELKLFGFNYRIVSDHSEECKKEIDPCLQYPDGCKGKISFPNQTIYLSPELPFQQQIQTLLHEILHAISYHIAHGTLFSEDTEQEEWQVDTLASGLYEILAINGFLPESEKECQQPTQETKILQENSIV